MKLEKVGMVLTWVSAVFLLLVCYRAWRVGGDTGLTFAASSILMLQTAFLMSQKWFSSSHVVVVFLVGGLGFVSVIMFSWALCDLGWQGQTLLLLLGISGMIEAITRKKPKDNPHNERVQTN